MAQRLSTGGARGNRPGRARGHPLRPDGHHLLGERPHGGAHRRFQRVQRGPPRAAASHCERIASTARRRVTGIWSLAF